MAITKTKTGNQEEASTDEVIIKIQKITKILEIKMHFGLIASGILSSITGVFIPKCVFNNLKRNIVFVKKQFSKWNNIYNYLLGVSLKLLPYSIS